ncbi:hypothetical protein ACP70R_036126 [Stipagrostis hirtigluma subsp. patula]
MFSLWATSIDFPLRQRGRLHTHELRESEMESGRKQQPHHFILVHGVCHGAWCWYRVATALEAAGHRVTALDMAGCGASPARAEEVASFEEYSRPLLDAVAALPEGEKAVLVGHSFGGQSLALAMERYPDKVAVAVFVSAAMPAAGKPMVFAFQQGLFEYFEFHSARSSMDSDDVLSFFSDDDDDGTVGDAIFELYKKHKINNLKRRFGAAYVSELCNLKSKKGTNVKSNFSQLSLKCFVGVVSALSSDKIAIIERFGFGCVLSFVNCGVPKSFVNWISSIVDVRTSELVFKDRIIPFNKHSIHKILGLPVGGQVLVGDSEAGKSFLRSKFGVDNVDCIQFFADKIIGGQDMTDEEVFISFMVLVHVLERPNEITKYDWSLYLYELVLDYVCKLQKVPWKPINDSIVFCSSSYVLAVLYLDCVNFGSYHVSPEFPRTSFWKASAVKFCSELDELKSGKYGRRPLKIAIDTSYSQNAEELESLYGDVLPEELKLGISKIYGTHCVQQAKMNEHSCEELLFKIFSFCNELSEKVKYENSLSKEPASHVATELENGDVKIGCNYCNFAGNVDGAGCSDLELSKCDVKFQLQDKIEGTDVVLHQNLAALSKPAVDLSTPRLIIGRNISSSAPSLLRAASPIVKPKRCGKGPAIGSKPNMLDLNSCASDCVFHAEDFITPKDNVIEVDTVAKMAEVKVNFPSGQSNKPDCPNVFANGSKAVFDVESQQYFTVRNAVRKEKFLSKSGHFLSKLQIHDLNVPLPESDEVTPNDICCGQLNVDCVPHTFCPQPHVKSCMVSTSKIPECNASGAQNLSHDIGQNLLKSKSKAAVHVQSISKGLGSKKDSGHRVTNNQAAIGSGKEYVCVPDSDDEDNLPVQQVQSVPLIHLDDNEEEHAHDANDVEFLGEVSFKNKIRSMCDKSEILYNKSVDVGPSCLNDDCAGPSAFEPAGNVANPVRIGFQGQSICKPQAWSSKFALTDKDRRNYLAACRLANSTKYNNENAVEIGGCYIKYRELGNSLRTGSKVASYVINAICRKFFLDKRPTISRKHYFFSSVGAILLKGSGSISYVKKCFDGAASVLPLHRADMLLFPICHDEHWFLFIVDIKNTLFIPSFKKFWNELVSGPIDFESFDVVYPSVPKQNNLVDCDFSQDDIDNIRIYLVSSLVCSEHNVGHASPITNYYGEGSYP